MNKEFERAFARLNDEQRRAVETIDGPVLVIAGPGTGKTQLVSTRVGHILRSTDTLPTNILLLTFTEVGVNAMRERLASILGKEAYEVNISTYHAFGSELLRRNPQSLDEINLEPIDDIGAVSIVQNIIRRMPYSNPMKFMDDYPGDILNFISDSKRALLLPEDIIATAEQNLKFIARLNKDASDVLKKITAVSKKTAPLFGALQLKLEAQLETYDPPGSVRPNSEYAAASLKEAMAEFLESGSTKPITAWKNTWLAKDEKGDFIFGGKNANQKLLAAGELYGSYQAQLKKRRQFDFDDMILRAIHLLENNPDVKFTFAEQYQYIMLDEFQDTNPAQLRLIELLTDHPVHEGKPNILAVGDDDQAIYAFQGADHGNMMEFTRHFQNVKLIPLTKNYRSHAQILQTAANVAAQISERLHQNFEGIEKDLVAEGKYSAAKLEILAREFKSDIAHYSWVASKIKELVEKDKILPSEIAVLAPKHRFLQPLLPYLASEKIPVRYEKRENILDNSAVRQLEQMSRLVLALADNNQPLADSLWPEVLSYDFWGLSTEQIWQISWQADSLSRPWIESLLTEKSTEKIALLFLRLKNLLSITSLEQQLDALMGLDQIADYLQLPIKSPFFGYYYGEKSSTDPAGFISLLSNLTILRARLRQWRGDEDQPLGLRDFIEFIEAHRSGGISIINSSPYNEADESVNIMTAYGAKGREFRAVFLAAATDEVWGSASRGQGSRISLPVNLKYIRYQGASEDERLRLLYVAITRAKTNLYVTSYSKTMAGRPTSRLKYLDTFESEGKVYSRVLPPGFDEVSQDDQDELTVDEVQDYWTQRHHTPFKPSLKKTLTPRLERYQLAPTHLSQFTDVSSAGPQTFFINTLLRFPSTPSPAAAYGSSVHDSLRWFLASAQRGSKPNASQLLSFFERNLLGRRLSEHDFGLFLDRGRLALSAWLKQTRHQLDSNDRYEHNFARGGTFLDEVRLAGKIDYLKLDAKNKRAKIIDFKTGKSYKKWDSRVIKLHKYRQQLLIYKLLVENSPKFSGYKAEKGVLEFIEPDSEGQIVQLELLYEPEEVEQIKLLVRALWKRVHNLDFPDVSGYPPTVAGIKQFEKDLIGRG